MSGKERQDRLTSILEEALDLPRARRAFRYARETTSSANGALAEGIRAVRTVQGMRREAVNFVLYDEKVDENLRAHLKSAKMAQIMVPIVDTLTGAAMAISPRSSSKPIRLRTT